MKESNKKIVQDVIPPKRSIRNLELPQRDKLRETFEKEIRKEEKKEEKHVLKKEVPIPQVSKVPTEEAPEKSKYQYEYTDSGKRSKKWPYVTGILIVLAIGFGISTFFKSAVIRITPKQETKIIDVSFTAKKDTTNSELGFQTVTITKEVQKTVTATGEERVDKKAKGQIIIYNNWSTTPQKLVATTRFQTPEGLIFRLINPATIPGRQTVSGKTVAGSIEVVVEADKVGNSYNIGLKDFSIPGFQGDPKYTQIYARSKTAMTGGFSGMQKIVAKDLRGATDKELETQLKDSLSKDIVSQIPANFVLYSKSISYNFEPIGETSLSENTGNANTAILRKKATATGIIFDKASLSRFIGAKTLPTIAQNTSKVDNLSDLTFTLKSSTSTDVTTRNSIDFSLTGNAHFVWITDENKLKSDLLGLSKKSALAVIATYPAIQEAWIETQPFWNQTIPDETLKVSIVNTTEAEK